MQGTHLIHRVPQHEDDPCGCVELLDLGCRPLRVEIPDRLLADASLIARAKSDR
jgi:hypothetical protein